MYSILSFVSENGTFSFFSHIQTMLSRPVDAASRIQFRPNSYTGCAA